jgi:hypothetical protein
MVAKKTLQQREKELQSLLATKEGKKELEALEARYRAAGGKFRPTNTSVVTYLLVHERGIGLIST